MLFLGQYQRYDEENGSTSIELSGQVSFYHTSGTIKSQKCLDLCGSM